MSHHELQELLFLGHDQGATDDEELLLLYEEFLPKNSDFSYENYDRLDLKVHMTRNFLLAYSKEVSK